MSNTSFTRSSNPEANIKQA